MGAALSASFHASTSINQCLHNAVGYANQVTYPQLNAIQFGGIPRYNLDVAVSPIAVTYPKDLQQVAAVVSCASQHDLPVQAKSGGHGYGNHGQIKVDYNLVLISLLTAYGAQKNTVVVDMNHLNGFSIDSETFVATIGPGNRLIDVNKNLRSHGRSIPHGTCPSVGFGGHATVGGFGPTSRMWGLALDHIEEMTVVLANSTIRTVSAESYPDLFFAFRGAAASLGIVTEFKVRTRPIPPAVRFSHSLRVTSFSSMAETFKTWQNLVGDPAFSRKFFTQVELNPLGMTISGTYFGSQKEFEEEPLWLAIYGDKVRNRLHGYSQVFRKWSHMKPLVFNSIRDYSADWSGLVTQWAGGPVLGLVRHSSSYFYHRSVTLTNSTLMSPETIDEFFAYLDNATKGTAVWFIIFDLEGGATNDVLDTSSAFAHRSALIYLQSYAIQPFGPVSRVTKEFVRGLHRLVEHSIPSSQFYRGIYPGYVDTELSSPQEQYWTVNLDRLRRIKHDVDPNNVFRHPQSIRAIDLDELR